MIANTTHVAGWKARDFALQGTDGKNYSLAEVRGPKGTLVVFICNHCPYEGRQGSMMPNPGRVRSRNDMAKAA